MKYRVRWIPALVSHGVGSAQLVMKKTHDTAWKDVLAVTRSRYLPHPRLYVQLRREEKPSIHRSFALPLYLKDQEAFELAVMTNAPEGHPLRAVFET